MGILTYNFGLRDVSSPSNRIREIVDLESKDELLDTLKSRRDSVNDELRRCITSLLRPGVQDGKDRR